MNNNVITIFHDFSASTYKKRAVFLNLKKCLWKQGITYSMLRSSTLESSLGHTHKSEY